MIALDTSVNGGSTTGTSMTYSHTCSGSQKYLVVLIHTGSDVITGITYNGVAMTQAVKIIGVGVTYFYVLANPSSGANNIVISASSSDTIEARSVSYTSAQQTTTPDATNSNQNNGISNGSWQGVSVTTIANNCWTVLGSVKTYAAGTAPIAGGGSTLRQSSSDLGLFDSNGVITPAGSYSMNSYSTDGTQNWCNVILSIAPYTAPATIFNKMLQINQAVNRGGNY